MSKLRSLFQNPKNVEKGLERSKKSFFSKLSLSIVGKSKVDDAILDELEEILITSDVGVATTIKIIEKIEVRIAKEKYLLTSDLTRVLKEEIIGVLPQYEPLSNNYFEIPLPYSPYVVMVVGVNGVGKTTTIGKLAYHFSKTKKVVLGAADTFRAGAIEQLQTWADRAKANIVKQKIGSDPASVVFETLEIGMKEKADIIFIDTAGRLHNKINLMNELARLKKIMNKVIPNTPNEVLLVLDGSTGQNAFEQAKKFREVVQINSLAITKLDGSAKGGVVIGICDQFSIPLKYIGVGEKMEDLQFFDKEIFVHSFFK